jgi:hypothetical protein
MRRRIVKKLQHERVPLKGLLNDAALHTCSAAMDEPDLTQAGGVSLVQILLDDGRDVAGRKGVEVEVPFDWNPERVLILHSQSEAGFS